VTVSTDTGGRIWTRIEAIARQIARQEIDAALRNQRPGGLVPVGLSIAAPVASSTVPAGHIDIPFPCKILYATFRSTVAGSAVLNITVRRPGQTAAGAASIVGATPPSITGATDAVVVPGADWTTFIEAESTLYYYLTSVSGFDVLTPHLWVQATEWHG
jgi:hypothetical protein